MKIHVLLAGATMRLASGNLTTSTVTLVDHSQGPMLIDTAAWNQRRALLAALESRGLHPSDVRLVVLTHLHWDHCLNFELFEHAHFLVPRREWTRVTEPIIDSATPYFIRQELQHRAPVELVDPGEIVPGIWGLESPGHTSGHMSYLVQGRTRVVVSGDALPTLDTTHTGIPHLIFGDPDKARRSVQELLAAADVIVPGHDAPFTVNGTVYRVPTIETEASDESMGEG